jgi:PAS domain S-box-containing protein
VPASCAFHTGQRFLSNDLANDIKVGPWRQVASVRGLGAATALPLRCGGRVVGSFTVYAAEAGFFDDELLELLDEMAVDISFALDNFVREAASATAAEALRASEERYRELLQSLNDVVWSYTLESRTLYLNDAASVVYGRARQDLIENPALWLAAVHPEDAAAVRSASGRLLSTGRAEGEYRIVRPDGEIRWLHDRATVIRNGAGETIRFAGVATDVTSRKLAEQALRDGRALLRTIIDTVPLWLSYLDRDGRYIVANRRHSETFDKSTSDIEGAHFRDVLPAALYERQRLLFDECLQGKVVRFTEELLLAGQQIHAQGVLVPRMDEQDGVQGVVVAVTDITELRRSEERLLASEARLNEAQHLAHIGSWELDIPSNHLDWSDETYQIFETDRQHFPGTLDAFLDLVHADDRDLVRNAYTESIGKGTPHEFVHRLRPRDGRTKYVLERCRTIYGADGTPLRSLGSVQDITAVKDAEQQIRALNEQLERRVQERTAELENTNRELESFSYSVSHDLRAPLRAIDGFSAIIEREHATELDEDARHMLSRVRLAVQRMGRLIDDLLGLSRLSRSALNRTPTNLSAVAAEIVTELREGAANSQVAVKLQPGVVADADPNLIRIALANLLGNAWKFSSKRAAPRIEFGATKIEGRNGTCYFVRDNGAGFDMRYAGKLFGPFQRLHGETEFAGTGIGLATVQRIIHRHGGRVWAEAAVDAGATFYFTLGA